MTQRHSRHKRHESNRRHKEGPRQGCSKNFTLEEITTVQPQTLMIPLASPWSVWALDPERGFYYRTRINAIGRYEWDFHTQSSISQISSCMQPGQQPNCYCSSPPAAPALTLRQYLIFPTEPTLSEDESRNEVEFSHDFDDEVTSRASGSSFIIPAIIDVDTKNNVKVLVPDPKTGKATKIWDNKHKHTHKSNISPEVKVREW